MVTITMKVVSIIVLFFICKAQPKVNGPDINRLLPNNVEMLSEGKSEHWTGRWFPDRVSVRPFIQQHTSDKSDLYDSKHGIKMGVPSEKCDNAKVNLTIDWDYSPEEYVCYSPKRRIIPNPRLDALLKCHYIPKNYVAQHACMDKKISYSTTIPTFGTHRPLWPRYGEYRYVPPQRWLHNLEHGGIVLLYHPCANIKELNILRQLVKSCLYRHVITPYKYLSPERPFALVSWGCHLTMSKVDPKVVIDFIRSKALQGPEKTNRDGQYSLELIEPAQTISDPNDSLLCLNY